MPLKQKAIFEKKEASYRSNVILGKNAKQKVNISFNSIFIATSAMLDPKYRIIKGVKLMQLTFITQLRGVQKLDKSRNRKQNALFLLALLLYPGQRSQSSVSNYDWEIKREKWSQMKEYVNLENECHTNGMGKHKTTKKTISVFLYTPFRSSASC